MTIKSTQIKISEEIFRIKRSLKLKTEKILDILAQSDRYGIKKSGDNENP